MRNPDRSILKVTLLAASMLVTFGGAIMAPTLPAIGEQFREVPNIEFWIRFVLTIPSLLIAINAPIAGYIVDRFGRKTILVTSVIFAGLAGFSGYLAPTFVSILAGRAVLGIAVAGVMTGTTTLIADYYYGQERSRFMGLQAGVMGLGQLVPNRYVWLANETPLQMRDRILGDSQRPYSWASFSPR